MYCIESEHFSVPQDLIDLDNIFSPINYLKMLYVLLNTRERLRLILSANLNVILFYHIRFL